MKRLLWTTSYNEDLIIKDITRYCKFKNGNCCRKNTITLHFNKIRINITEVIVESPTELQESLHYYAICSIIADYGNKILLSV